MPSERTPLVSSTLPRGTYAPAGPGDKRSPCPMVNSLANHGYIARNGQNIPARELNAAMNEVGISKVVGAVFSQSVYNLHQDPNTVPKQYLWKQMGFFQRLWAFIRNPWSILCSFGMRKWDPKTGAQKNDAGKAVLDLDQLALPGVIEHDVSLTRRDYLQDAGNLKPQPDLVEALLACSEDGKITMEALAAHRKKRIQQQLEDNPGLQYGSLAHELGCGEIALILGVFGDGKSVPCEYARAFFQEERLPIKEGWKKRWWWTLGFPEIKSTGNKVKALIGLQI